MRNYTQTITYWTSTPNGFGGYSYSVPALTTGRWENRADLFRDKTGVEVTSKSVVYLDIELTSEDYIFLGTSVVVDPTLVTGAMQIKGFDSIPDLRNLSTVYKAYLTGQ